MSLRSPTEHENHLTHRRHVAVARTNAYQIPHSPLCERGRAAGPGDFVPRLAIFERVRQINSVCKPLQATGLLPSLWRARRSMARAVNNPG